MRTTTRMAITALPITSLLVAASVAVAADTATAGPAHSARHASHPTPQIAAVVRSRIARHGSADVLVLLRSKTAVVHPDTARNHDLHVTAVRDSQRPVLSALDSPKRASAVHAFRTFDAISARVTRAGLAQLAARDDVAAVAPNATIKMAPDALRLSESGSTERGAQAPKPTEGTPTTAPGGVCSSTPQVTEDLETTRTRSNDPDRQTASKLGATGDGVTVAFMAEGIDVNNPDFVRPDGNPVFTDYQDFTGEGTTAPTDGLESFLDASSIASQGRTTYDLSHISANPDLGKCRIKIFGVAPGANLVALKVFGEHDLGTTSGFLQAIDYAVNTDHVNVLNQSFGSNGVPDTTMDVIRAADEAAVAAGTVITVSSGDQGVTNTQGSPSTSPGVISVGATTTTSPVLQAGYDGSHLPIVKGFRSDNISTLSSGGTNEDGGTIDLAAPGDSSFIPCTPDPAQYSDCGTSNTILVGGTSESAPLTAGGAALVIQAYRQTHHNHSPTPVVVKRILLGTARDINAPADLQGAGELNTYRAVLAARSLPGDGVTPSAQGVTTLTDTSQIDVVGAPGSAVSKRITVTNTGSSTQTITPSTRTLGTYTKYTPVKVVLSDKSPTYHGAGGYQDPYRTVRFSVPAGTDRLDTSMAWVDPKPGADAPATLALIGPHGAYNGNNFYSASNGHTDVQITRPAAGTWTALIFTAPAAVGGLLGTYHFGFRTARFAPSGSVSAPITLAPGASGTVTYTSATPSSPGDSATSIVLASSTGRPSTVPVVLRSLIPLSAVATPVKGELTGSAGFPAAFGQVAHYQFDVVSGTTQLNAEVRLARNPNNPFFLSLIDPHGDQVGYGSNVFLDNLAASPVPNLAGAAHVLHPQAGRWSMVVNFAPFTSGDALTQPFHVLVDDGTPSITSTGLPSSTSTTLPAGQQYDATIAIKNTTSAPEAYFADARSGSQTTYTLAGSADEVQVPLTAGYPSWLVPSETTSVTGTATSTKSVQFDMGPEQGDPDIESSPGTTSSLTYSAPTVTSGSWYEAPSLVGPYGSVPSRQATTRVSMTATTAGFDRTVTSTTRDLWLQAVSPNASAVKPVVVQPGKTGVITVHIVPSGSRGSTVSGTLYVDDLASFTPSGVSPNANEVAALPYTYKIG